MVVTTFLQQKTLTVVPSTPPTIVSSCAGPFADSMKPSPPPLGPPLLSYAFRFLTHSTNPTQAPLPSTLQRLRKSPFMHNLPQYLKQCSPAEEDKKQE